MKKIIRLNPLGAVPLSLIDRHHPPALARKPIIREIIRRVREYHIDRVIWD
jgi:hypothetical protein